jgi:hypothetical protein
MSYSVLQHHKISNTKHIPLKKNWGTPGKDGQIVDVTGSWLSSVISGKRWASRDKYVEFHMF